MMDTKTSEDTIHPYERVVNPTAIPQVTTVLILPQWMKMRLRVPPPFRNVYSTPLDQTYKSGYRRYKGYCCEEIKTIDGFRTRAWSPKFTIEEFVHSLARKTTTLITGRTSRVGVRYSRM